MPETPGIAKLSGRFLDEIGLFRTIKKPACGRLLGDWLGSFLVNRASLQNVHPDLASGCGTRRENHLPCRCDLSRGAGRCANVGRSILIFLGNSQCGVRGRAIGWALARVIRLDFPVNAPPPSPACRRRGRRGVTGTEWAGDACSASNTKTPTPTPGCSALRFAPP